ncbi:MAG: hypothetical protein HY902_01500, partial [Deltaproteobacteria bacterium]|nr:hypothetical protein [Deltaproteobacteria bacterium]
MERALRSRSPLLWFAVAAAIIGYCGMPLSDHPDTLRDLLAARDCIERGDCAAEGATTSFGNLHNGALWPFLLAMLRAAHLPTPTIWWLVLFSDALTVALVFVGVDHAAHKGLPPRQVTAHSSHLAALAALTLLVVERTPNTVWSPALAPWLAALVVAWWLRWRVDPPAAPWGPLVLGVLLALLVDSHPANWPCAAAWLAALVVVESRPVAALAWSGAGLAAATALLAPATQWRNLAVVAAGIHDPLLVLLGGTLVAAAGRALPHSWRHQPAFAPLAAAFGAGAILIGGTVAFGRDLEVRYLTPALLTGCAALAALPWPTLACRLPIAGLAVGSALLAAVRLGPGNISAGHSWPVVQQVAAALDGAGIRYPASAARIQGYGCQRLAAAAEVEATTGPWMATAPRPDGVQVLDLPSHLPAPAGWWLLERRPASSTYWRTQRFWLDTGAGRACLLRGAS